MIEPGRTAIQAQPPSDSGLRCPGCEYNLTGVVEDRCPECGEAFDREQLNAVLAGAPAPIPIWEDESQDIIVRFIKMCLLTWFVPTRLGRWFPCCYRLEPVRRFRYSVVFVVWFAYAVPLTLSQNVTGLALSIAGLLVWLSGVASCEAMLRGACGLFLWMQDRHRVPTPGAVSGQWLGIINFFRSFVLLEAAALGIAWVGGSHGPGWVHRVGAAGMVLVFIWWWAAFAAVVLVQPVPASARIATIISVPLVSLAAIFAAIMVAALLSPFFF